MSSCKPRDSGRSRNFALLLYPQEDATHAHALEVISGLNAVWIVHDKDRTAEGDVKKMHTHVILQLADACTVSALASRLGIESNYVQVCRNVKQGKRYLVHKDDLDKYQYPVEDLLGPLAKSTVDLIQQGEKPCEDELALAVLDWIESIDGVVSMSMVMRWSLENGCYSCLRRGATLYREVIREHNNMYYERTDVEKPYECADVTMARFNGYVMGAEDARKDKNYER